MKFHASLEINELRADLESVRLGLGREVTLALMDAGAPTLAAAKALTPVGPGPDGRTKDDLLPHIRDTLKLEARGRVLKIVSRHPGSGVVNYGGTIEPHGARIEFERRLMGQRAGEAELPALEADLERRLDALLARHHL